MTIAEEILNLRSRVSAAFSACEAKSATMPSIRTTHTLADTINTIPTGGQDSREDEIIMRTISGSYQNSNVSFIGANAFRSCTSLTTVSFPNATSIGANAFEYCDSLTTVSFPNATTIGTYAFQSCTSLTTVSFPNATTIGTYAFQSCTSLTSVSIPNVASIGIGTFRYCSSLTKAIIGGRSGILGYAFNSCKSLSQIFIVGGSVGALTATALSYTPMSQSSYLGYFGSIYVRQSLLSTYQTTAVWSTFKDRIVGVEGGPMLLMKFSDSTSSIVTNIESLTSKAISTYKASLVEIQDLTQESEITVTESKFAIPYKTIGDQAFDRCSSLTIASFPNVTSIGSYAFQFCNSLTIASFPNATSIGPAAFTVCNSLTIASFPNVTSIGSNAFQFCNSLTIASFPNVTSIGSAAFYSCSRLTSIYFTGSSVPTLADSNAFSNIGTSYSIYVAESLYSKYIVANQWSMISSRITSYI